MHWVLENMCKQKHSGRTSFSNLHANLDTNECAKIPGKYSTCKYFCQEKRPLDYLFTTFANAHRTESTTTDTRRWNSEFSQLVFRNQGQPYHQVCSSVANNGIVLFHMQTTSADLNAGFNLLNFIENPTDGSVSRPFQFHHLLLGYLRLKV